MFFWFGYSMCFAYLLTGGPEASWTMLGIRDLHGDPLPEHSLGRFGTSLLRQAGGIDCIAFSPDGSILASANWKGVIVLWDIRNGHELRRIRGVKVNALAWSGDGKLLASGSSSDFLRVWDIESGTEIARCTGHPSSPEIGDNTCLAFTEDGKVLVSAGPDRFVRRWEPTTGKRLSEFVYQTKGARVQRIALSPRGQWLAVADDDDQTRKGSLWIYDARIGNVKHKLLDSVQFPLFTFSVNEQRLVSSVNDGPPIIWDVLTGKPICQLPSRRHWLRAITFSGNGMTLATEDGSKGLEFWDARTGERQRRPRIPYRGRGNSLLAFSPQNVLATVNHSSIHLWNASTGAELHSRQEHEGTIHSLTWIPKTSFIVSGSIDGHIRLWDTLRRRPLAGLIDVHPQTSYERGAAHPQDDLKKIAIAPDGRSLALLKRGQAWVSRQQNEAPKPRELLSLVLKANDNRPLSSGGLLPDSALAFSPDGTTVAVVTDMISLLGSHYARLCLYRMADGQLLYTASIPYGDAFLEFSHDGKLIALASRRPDVRSIFIHNATSGARLAQLESTQASVLSLACSPDSQTIASGGSDGTALLWDITAREAVLECGSKTTPVRSLAFSSDGKSLAIEGSDNSISIWETATGKERCRFSGHTGSVTCMTFTFDNRCLLSGSSDTTVLMWDVTLRQTKPPAGILTKLQLEQIWKDLASDNCARAHAAIWGLVFQPEASVSFLRERVQPVPVIDRQQVARLIAELDGIFDRRKRATDELERLGDGVRASLKEALRAEHTLEFRRRVEMLLKKIDARVYSGERLRVWRVLEILEHIANEEAKDILATLARGAPEYRVTQEAAACLNRLCD
jgi:WD40 repeat protein